WFSLSLFQAERGLSGTADLAQVVLQALQDRALFSAALCAALLDQRLDQLNEHLAAAQRAAVQKFIDLDDVARHPELHQLVYLVDQRNRTATGRFHAKR